MHRHIVSKWKFRASIRRDIASGVESRKMKCHIRPENKSFRTRSLKYMSMCNHLDYLDTSLECNSPVPCLHRMVRYYITPAGPNQNREVEE